MAKKPANGKLPWMKFFPADWRADPALRMCSISARGLWMEMLCLMHDAAPCGSLVVNGKQVGARQIAALAGIPLKEAEPLVQELEDAGVFSRDDDGTIFSRRMRKDIQKAEQARSWGSTGGNPDLTGKDKGSGNGGVNPPDNNGENLKGNHANYPEENVTVEEGVKDRPRASDRAHTRATQRPEARGQIDKPASAAPHPAAAVPKPPEPEPPPLPEQDLAKRIRIAMGSEPVIATADYPTGILRMLAEGRADGSIVEDDVFAGIATMFERAEIGFRCRRFSQVEGWIRGAAKDRLAGKVRVLPAGTQAAASVPSSMIRGVVVPDVRIQARVDRFYRDGEWPEDVRDRWGPSPDEAGCCIPPKFLKPKVDA